MHDCASAVVPMLRKAALVFGKKGNGGLHL